MADFAAEMRQHGEDGARRFVAIVKRWPNFREHLACAELGSAVAIADSMGVDVEGFIAKLRAVQPKPPVLIPPEGS